MTVPPADRRRTGLEIAALLFLTVLSAYLARISLSVALPFIATDFGWDREQLGGLGGVLLGIFLVGYGLSNVFLSPLADCYGPRKGLLIAVASWSVLTFLTGLFGMFFSVFMLLRVLLGVAQGVVFPAAGKITQAWFPPEKRSRMNALYYGAIGLSNLLSPLLLIPLIMVSSWNTMFLLLAASSSLLLMPMAMRLKDSPAGPPVCEQKTLRDNLALTWSNLKEAARTKGLFTLTLSHTTYSMVFWGISLWLPTFLVVARGFSRDELVWAAALPYIGYLAGLYVGSTLSDRTGRRSLITGTFCIAGAVMLALLIQVQGQAQTIIVVGGLFFFLALVGPNIATLLQGCCTSRLTCSATGIENGIANGMGALGPVIFGLAAAITGSYDAALPIMIVLLIISGSVILRFRIAGPATCPVGGREMGD